MVYLGALFSLLIEDQCLIKVVESAIFDTFDSNIASLGFVILSDLVPFPGLSSSGDQVLGECTLPVWRCILSPPPSQLLGFLGALVTVLSQVCRVSPLGG